MTSTPRKLFDKLMSFKSPKNTTANVGLFKAEKKVVKTQNLPINIILMGQNCTGKSVFLSREQDDIYDEGIGATIGSSFKSKKYKVDVEKIDKAKSMNDLEPLKAQDKIQKMNVELRVWDTNGHSKYRDTLKLYIAQDNIPKLCLIFYDVSKRKTFEEVENFYKIWIQKLSNQSPEKNSVIIVANKTDLQQLNEQQNDKKDKNFVSFKQGLELAKKLGTLFVRSSSLFDVSKVVQIIFQYKLAQLGYKLVSIENRKPLLAIDAENGKMAPKKLMTKQIGKLQKSKLIKMLIQFQNFKTKSKKLKFESIISKYLTTLQMKICCEEKIKNLQTIQSLLNFMKSRSQALWFKLQAEETKTWSLDQEIMFSSSNQNIVANQIKALQIMKNFEQVEIDKVSHAISSFFKRAENKGDNEHESLRYEDFLQFKMVYESFKEVANENINMIGIEAQELKNLEKDREVFQKFFDQIICYIDKISIITTQLQNKINQPLQQSNALSTSNLMVNLLQFFIQQKSQSLRPSPLNPLPTLQASTQFNSLCKLIESKQQKQIVQGMNNKDEKYIGYNLCLLNQYVGKVSHIVVSQVVGKEEHDMRALSMGYNRERYGKEWGCLKFQQEV